MRPRWLQWPRLWVDASSHPDDTRPWHQRIRLFFGIRGHF